MDAKTRFPFALVAISIIVFSSCSKFSRINQNQNFTSVKFGKNGSRDARGTPQTGGVMIWGISNSGDRFAIALSNETEDRSVSLRNGSWTFFATGWTGSDFFQGTNRCATTVQDLVGLPTTVTLSLQTAQCGGSFFGGASFAPGGSLLPLRLTTCRSASFAAVSGGDDSACSGSSTIGPFQSFKVSLNGYSPTGTSARSIVENLSTQCKTNPSWASTGASLNLPSVSIPIGDGTAGSPIDTSIYAYTDASCASPATEFHFPNGIAGGANFSTSLFGGSSPSSASLYLLGPGPSVTSLSPSSGAWAGGDTITIGGDYLYPGTTVTMNGKPCSQLSNSINSYVCTSPISYTAGNAAIVVDNTVQSQTLAAPLAFNYQQDSFGNAVDSETVGATVMYNSNVDWSSASSLGSRTASASRNVTNITQGANSANLSLGTSFTAADFDVHDEVLWHVSAASSSTACSAAGDLTVGKFGFGRVISASSPSISISGTISATPNNTNIAATSRNLGDTFCVIQLVKVPNFKNLTIDTSSSIVQITRQGFDYSAGHGGIIAFRVAGALTYTGTNVAWLMLKGLGYPGGAGATLPYQGAGRLGLGLTSATQLANNDMGGAPGLSVGGGGGAGAGDGGDGGAATPSGKGIGVTGCLPSANCALFGGGGGGGNTSGADGGAGGGIGLIFANQVVFSSFSNVMQPWAGGQQGLGSATVSSGAGAGGTIYVAARTASTAQLSVVNAGGHAAGGGPSQNGGGAGAGGVTETRECAASSFSSFSSNVGSGNLGVGSIFNGTAAGSGVNIRNQLSAGTEFCP